MLSSIAGLLAVEDGRSRWMGLIAEIGVPVLWGVRCLFLPEDSHDFEHAVRLAISLGGDSDTIACITGSIAEAFYKGVPDALWAFAEARLTDDLRIVCFDRIDKRSRGLIDGDINNFKTILFRK